jgi:4-hydroxybenzoate polyprenyltransferase
VLFVGRIVLKDFRDRAGDAKYCKPTLLLAHGKSVTLAISAGLVTAGTLLVWLAGPVTPLWLLVAPTILLALTLVQLHALNRAPISREQVLIGIGAKLGNGALITLLGLMLLQQSHAGTPELALFATLITAVILYSYFQISRTPQAAVNAYKG